MGDDNVRAVPILPSSHNGPYPFGQNGLSQHMTAHREECLRGLAIQSVSAPPRGMDRGGWGHNQRKIISRIA